MSNLIWNSITLANEANGDFYALSDWTPGASSGESLGWPNTKGMEWRPGANQTTPQTARRMVYAGATYKATRAELLALWESVETKNTSQTAALGSLSSNDGSITGTFRCEVSPGKISRVIKDGAALWAQHFTATFVRYGGF